jgi:aspartyl-tRNA(Asn)/glutamyl-tRNA(Gln) amidotransferase subunit C
MSVDEATVRRIAGLARIGVKEEQIPEFARELSQILAFVERLDAVNTDGVMPLTSAVERQIKRRDDVVSDGGKSADILANAPIRDDDYFAVPKVVE